MILQSLLDTDLYKFTMQYAVWRHFPRSKARYCLIDRSRPKVSDHFIRCLQDEIQKWKRLQFSRGELRFLDSLDLFSRDFLEYLRNFRFSVDQIEIKKDVDGRLSVNIEGPWLETILWEVPVLGAISELYFAVEDQKWETPETEENFYQRTFKKATKLIRGGGIISLISGLVDAVPVNCKKLL